MDLYLRNEKKISKIRSQVMPYLKAVEEARENAETYLSNVGDELDPTKEQMDVENEAEGISEHPELSFKAPDLREENSTVSDKTFRAIELQSDSELSDRLKKLDKDQQEVLREIQNYAMNFKIATKKKEKLWPKPPLLMVHGSGGCGKSHIIDWFTQVA